MRKLVFIIPAIIISAVAAAQSTNMSDGHTPIIDPPGRGGKKCECKEIKDGITAGPLQLAFQANPTSPTPDAQGYCYYAVNDAAVAMSFDGQITRAMKAENKVKVSFGRDCQTKKLTAVKVDWEGEVKIPELFIKIPGIQQQIQVFDMAVRKFSLTVSVNGNLSGSVTIRVTNQADRDLTWNKKIVMLRKGTNSDITFSFNNTNGFAGSFDFSGIKNINIDLCKQNEQGNEVILASFKNGSMDRDGTLVGQFEMAPGNTPTYATNLFRVTLLSLTLGLELKIPSASFRLTNGSGKVRVSEMKHVTGTIDLGLVFPGDGTCTATVEASDVSAFTMTLQDLKLKADFNEDFDMTEFRGSLKAKHNNFDIAIVVDEFLVKQGSLQIFNCGGSVTYSGFKFVLQKGKYEAAPQPKITIEKTSAKIDATGTAISMEVTAFSITEDGTISVGSLKGDLNRPPATLSFSAVFKNNEFEGKFKGEFAGIGLNGDVNIGAKPDYNFAYLRIEAQSNVGIPIGQSGLKLTSVEGRVGYNYLLKKINEDGQPQKGQYIVGMGVGVADIANMVGVKGVVVVQFGTQQFVFSLQGKVTVLLNNKFFEGTCSVNYTYPDQTLTGNVGAELKIPGSGWLLKSDNLNINFTFGNNKFSADGNNMSGKMFANKIVLSDGHFSLGGDLTNAASLKGKMGGKASCDFSYELSTTFLKTKFSGNVNLSMNSNIDLKFDQGGMVGGFDVTVNGSGEITVKNRIRNFSIGGDATCTGTVTYDGSTLTLTGNMEVTLPVIFPVWYPTDSWYNPSWTDKFSTGQISISF